MKKTQLLSSLLVLIPAVTPAIFATSCNKKSTVQYEELTAEFKEQAIKEFTTMVKTPHVTGRTRTMADYLKEYFKPYIVEDSWYEDSYRNEKSIDTSSGNICFDIKPSEGCESWPGVTLQGHYDMVGAGTTLSGDKGVDAIVDGNVMHSRHYESTLGADDGIGLGIIATIVKNQNNFKHGWLHILLTSDEEADLSGAYTIPKDTIDMVKYRNVINLDAEADKKITVSCAGTCATTYKFLLDEADYEQISQTETFYPYTVKVSGLLGGHSANCINEGRLSAIKILARILKELNYGNNLKIVSFQSNNKSSEISSEAETTFWVPGTTIGDLQNYIINPIWNSYKITNPIEKNLKIEITEEAIEPTAVGAPSKYLNSQGSWKLYTLLNDLPFGPIKWIDDSLKEVAVSNNIGDVHFSSNVTTEEEDGKISLKCFTRSCLDDEIDVIKGYVKQIGKNIFEHDAVVVASEDSPIWRYKEKNELFDIFSKGYNQIGITPTRRNAHSWLECAYFCQKDEHKDARMIAVGPLIKDAHSVNETLYLDTLDPLISSLLYTLRHINEL